MSLVPWTLHSFLLTQHLPLLAMITGLGSASWLEKFMASPEKTPTSLPRLTPAVSKPIPSRLLTSPPFFLLYHAFISNGSGVDHCCVGIHRCSWETTPSHFTNSTCEKKPGGLSGAKWSVKDNRWGESGEDKMKGGEDKERKRGINEW